MKKILLFASAVAVLFSSCSTDNTQDVIGIEAKNGAISATIAYQQDETRTHLANRKVVWSKGDAIGVFGTTGDEASQVQFGLVSGEGTEFGNFSGNTNYLTEGKSVYAYYPYTKGTGLNADKELKLEIMAKQTYRAQNTFDAAQAPGVAFVKELEDKEDVALDFKGVASYVTFPVMGSGTLKSLELTIKDMALAGVGTVDFDNYPTAEELATAEAKGNVNAAYADLALVLDNQAANSVTVDLGAFELDPRTPKYIMFVVPAGIKVSNEISLKATFANGDTKTLTKNALTTEVVLQRNAVQPINYNGGVAWTFGLDGKYLIDNTVSKYGLVGDDVAALDFITYAYFTQPQSELGSDFYPSMTDYRTLAVALGYDLNDPDFEAKLYSEVQKFEALILANEIDLEKFNVESVYATLGIMETESLTKAIIAVYKRALEWYKHNDYAIESLSFNAVRGYDAENPALIKNLTVLGNGVTAAAALENLEFENSIVIADNKDKAADTHAGFIAPTAGTATVKNVVIGAGNTLNAMSKPEGYIGGIFGVYSAGQVFDVEVKELPYIACESGATWGRENVELGQNFGKTGQVFGYVYAGSSNMTINLDAYKVTALNVEDAMPAIFTVVSSKKVIDFTADAALGAAPANVVAVNGTTATDKASIVINGVSYWNGDVAEGNIGGANYFTAEELAAVWAADAINKPAIVLTHDIDMQSLPVNVRNITDAAYNVSTTAKPNTTPVQYNTFEIKNVAATQTGGYATLFGQEATIKNVNLSNIVLNVRSTSETKSIAGIATTGTAQNVAIDGLTINIPENANLTCAEIGGVFGSATPEDIDNVSVNDLKINDDSYDAENRMTWVRTGAIAATLHVETTEEPIVLNVTKVSKINMGKFAKNQTNAGANGKNYLQSANWGGNYAYGTISINNAAFLPGYKLNAKLLQNTESVDMTDGNNGGVARLAAGIVFSLNGNLAVVNDGTACAYNFETNVAINAGNTKWGFNPVQ